MRGITRRGAWLAMAAAWFALPGCHYRYDFEGALVAIPKAQELLTTVPNVAIVGVSDRGQVFPKRLLVRGVDYAVVWVAAGKALSIRFEGAAITVACADDMALCVAGPFPAAEHDYTYTGTVTDKDGAPHDLDPHLEVVKAR